MSAVHNAVRLHLAAQRFAAGDVHSASCLCQLVLITEPRNPVALALLGEVGMRIGAANSAKRYLTEAAAAGNARAGTLLKTDASLLQPDFSALSHGPNPRFLVIKSWGWGFWAEICHVLGGLLLAEMTGRVPIIHLGESCKYGGSPTQDAFRHFFAPVAPAQLSDSAALNPLDRFPEKWRSLDILREQAHADKEDDPGPLWFLNARETVAIVDTFIGVPTLMPWIPGGHPLQGQSAEQIYRDLMARYLHPTAEVNAACDAFYDRHLRGAPFAALHLRGDDKKGEFAEHDFFNSALIDMAAELPADMNIFLMTDSIRHLEKMRGKFGVRVIAPAAARDDGSSIHFSLTGEGDPRQNGIEVLRDTLLGTRGDQFLGSGVSNVAAIVPLLRPWAPGTCFLVTPPYILQPMPYFYLPAELHGAHRDLDVDEYVELSE